MYLSRILDLFIIGLSDDVDEFFFFLILKPTNSSVSNLLVTMSVYQSIYTKFDT